MALKNCKDCGKEISKKAKTCPSCGAPQGPKQFGCVAVILVLLLAGFILVLIFSPNEPKPVTTAQHTKYSGTGECRQFVQLSQESADLDSPINVFGKTSSQGKFPVVGKMVRGSRALLLEILEEDFKVKSLLDGSVGYISHIQAEEMLWLNDKTFKPCK